MLRLLRNECTRWLNSPAFLISTLIGVLISISHIVQRVLPATRTLGQLYHGYASYPMNVFNLCMSGDALGVQMYIFMFCIPVLAVIPYGGSYFKERENGYINQVLTRISSKKYYIIKYISVFLSGFVTILIPLLFDFLATMLFVPMTKSDFLSHCDMVFERDCFGELFYATPLLYVILIFTIAAVFGGIYATMALGVSRIVKSNFVVLAFPLIFQLMFDYLMRFLSEESWRPIMYMSIYQGVFHMAAWKAGILILGFLALGIILFTISSVNRDTL